MPTPSSRPADRPTRRPARRVRTTRPRSPGCWRRPTGVEVERTLHLSTGIIGTRLPLDKVRDGLASIMPTLAPTDDASACGRGGPAHDRFGDQDRDHDDRAARCRRPARRGHPERHRQGRRDDPPADGHDARGRADRRGHRPRRRCGACSGRPRRGPGTSCRSTATRAPTTPSSSWPRGRRGPRRWGPAPRPPTPSAVPSRRSRATSPASRRPMARVPARSSPRP